MLQVTDGGRGQMSELDISVLLLSPDGQTVLADYKQSRGEHRVPALQAGDYKLCLSNKFSFLREMFFQFASAIVWTSPETG